MRSPVALILFTDCATLRTAAGLHRPVLSLFWIATLLSLVGCAGYQFGSATLFPPHIRTVHVPVFQSETYRRNLGERLTEAVIKEIELRGFKVVHSPSGADSVLRGRILSMDKHVLAENVNDVPRDLQVALLVEVTWTDRLGQVLMQHNINHAANFIPEAGQSIATAQQQALARTARQIVSRMEMRW